MKICKCIKEPACYYGTSEDHDNFWKDHYYNFCEEEVCFKVFYDGTEGVEFSKDIFNDCFIEVSEVDPDKVLILKKEKRLEQYYQLFVFSKSSYTKVKFEVSGQIAMIDSFTKSIIRGKLDKYKKIKGQEAFEKVVQARPFQNLISICM